MSDFYSDDTIRQVRDTADIRFCIPGADRSKPTSYVECPKCGKQGKGKGLCVTHTSRKNIAKCFSCGFSLSDAIAAAMYYECNDDRNRYAEAIKSAADANGIHIMTEQERRALNVKIQRKKIAKSFCERQLEASGLTLDDVMVHTVEIIKGERVEKYEPAMRRGSIDATGTVHPGDDEMLIYYYNLDGTMGMYPTRGARGALRPYIRIRWSNPALHTKEGDKRENKYMSPKDAPTRFYIPQKIRDLYNKSIPIETLVIQEGEKKAEKACKHGIPSIAIQGIFNIGNKETGLPQDLQYIVQQCKVKNVVLLFDSDWDDLSKNLNPDEAVDYRPRMFSKAAIKFKKYVATMHNVGVNVDIFFGHINNNDHGDKGIDDLLVGTLQGKEDELAKDVDFALRAHDGLGKYCSIFNMSTISDIQIQDYWLLNDIDAFYNKYIDRLKPLKLFKFNRFRYKVNEEGRVELASRVIADKEFWSVNQEKGRVSLDTFDALQFIEQAGFCRIHTRDMAKGEYGFIHIDEGVVNDSSSPDIRGFVWEYIKMTSKDALVLNHFAARLSSDLASDKLERLNIIEDEFDEFEPFLQRFYFRNSTVTVTPQGIKDDQRIVGTVWNNKVRQRVFTRYSIIDRVETDPVTGGYRIVATAEGEECDFFRFIRYTSNFWWQKTGGLTPQEEDEYNQHILNKLTAIGYLLTDYKFQTELKAVIAMDGEMSDVGQSNGRTGKSLIGEALKYVLEVSTVDGRNTKNDDDFMFTKVTPRTRNIFFDDVPVNFNFERLYVAITGDLTVNVKGGARYTIPAKISPKIYIATNHAINGSQTRSSQERIAYMGFSNYFNNTRHPVDVFGHQFFEDWDEKQWNLFYSLMIECVYLYFTSMQNEWHRPGQGVVPPPMHDIMQRTLRQQMSESLYQWAEVYFDKTGFVLNSRKQRGEMWGNFKDHFPDMRSGITPSNFKTRLKYYCQFKGLHFNPGKLNKDDKTSFRNWIAKHPGESFIGDDDKSGGIEYISIYDTDHALKEPF